MNVTQENLVYEASDEKELIKMWEDVKGTNTESLHRSLMKVVAKNKEKEGEQKVSEETTPNLFAREMWDSEKGQWVTFDMWGAHYIVNERKEYVLLRMLQPTTNQPEYDPVVKVWKELDSSYLNEHLKENKSLELKMPETVIGRGHRLFHEAFEQEIKESAYPMIKQDQQEYKYEGRYKDLPEYILRRRSQYDY